jgi:hypothetical protein
MSYGLCLSRAIRTDTRIKRSISAQGAYWSPMEG